MDLSKQSAVIFSSETATTILGFIALIFFARGIGATGMGIFFLFQSVVSILAIPADFGLRGAIEKRISEGQPADTVLTTALLLKIVPGSVIILGIIVFSTPLNNYVGREVAWYLISGLIISELAGVVNHVLIGELRAEHSGTLQLARQVVWVITGAVFISLGFEAEALILGLLAGWTVKFFLGWYLSAAGIGIPTLECARSLLAFAKYNSISYLHSTFYSWIDIAIIGLFLTQAHVGAYEIAWRVAQTVIILSQAIATVLLPQISKWSVSGQQERIEQLISNAITPSLFFIIPIFVGSFFVSHSLLTHVFGAEYAMASVTLVILLGGMHFHALFQIFRQSLLGIDRPDLVARAIIITFTANLVLNLVLVQAYGISGAALATTISYLMSTLLHWYYLSTFLTVQLPIHELGWCLFSSVIMAVVVVITRIFLPVNTIWGLIGIVLIGGIVYMVLAASYKPFREQISHEIQTKFI